jgi:HD-GYP domain-containing protein (c-di-GMP phosphodiesterase class II)
MTFRIHITKHALAARLTFGGVVIATVLGALTFYFEGERVDDTFVELALDEAQQFVRDVPEMAAPLNPANLPAIERALTDLVLRPAHNAPGDYLIAEIYDPDRNLIAEATEPNIDRIEQEVDREPHHFPGARDYEYRRFIVDGRLYLLVITKLRAADGRIAAYLEGVFRVAPTIIEDVRDATLRVTATVMLAVLATTLLLYPIIRRLNHRILRHNADLLSANLGTLRALGSAIAKRDSDTSHHNYRVTLLSIRLGKEAGLSAAAMRSLIKGAFIHDVGKIAISDNILLKPGRLTPEEFEVMKTHVSHGADIVRNTEWLADAAAVVRCHHEKFNGTGYPDGQSGEDIPIIARIFAIADVFDALTSERPYKKALPLDRSLEILIEGRGSHFDPRLLDAFLTVAAELYAAHANREEDSLAAELQDASAPYFHDVVMG